MVNFSGSTCVSIIYNTDKLICANVGDSRAVIGRYTNESNNPLTIAWTSHNISIDHKPDLKEELARIKKMGGRVGPLIGILKYLIR